MIIERYLEYLALNTILNDYMYISDYSKNEPICEIYLADKKPIVLNARKLRERITKIQKEFLEPYALDSTSKE